MLERFVKVACSQVRYNCHRASMGMIGRSAFPRQYPVMVVNPDGSTIWIRYHEPRKIIKLPTNLQELSFAERQERLSLRKPRKDVVKDAVKLEDTYKPDAYSFLWKDRKKS